MSFPSKVFVRAHTVKAPPPFFALDRSASRRPCSVAASHDYKSRSHPDNPAAQQYIYSSNRSGVQHHSYRCSEKNPIDVYRTRHRGVSLWMYTPGTCVLHTCFVVSSSPCIASRFSLSFASFSLRLPARDCSKISCSSSTAICFAEASSYHRQVRGGGTRQCVERKK